MSRLDKLKRLKNEVNRLLLEGFDVNIGVDKLRIDEQFAGISYERVEAFYNYLQEKFNAEAEDKRQIAEKGRQIEEHQQILEHLQQTAGNQQQIAERERGLAREQQMKSEMKFMTKHRQNTNKFLIYDKSFVNPVSDRKFWQERFFMTVEYTINNFHTINIQDLFQGLTKSFTIQKASRFCDIYLLTFPLVLLCDFGNLNRVTYFRLVKFDFESETLQVVQSFEYNGRCQILLNASNTSRFLLQRGNDVYECNLVDDQIQIGKKHSSESISDICCGSYFGEQFCSLKFGRTSNNRFRNNQLIQVKMLLYDLKRNENSTRDLDSTPKNLHCFDPDNLGRSAWVRDTIFVVGRFPLTGMYGVIFTNPQLRNWKFIEFATDLGINHIQSFVDGTLMICSEGEEQRKRKLYKLQMRKPDFLRNMAWMAIIKLFKEAKINNPYEEARQYLPLNSEIQPFMLTEN